VLHTKVFQPLLCGSRPSSPRPSAHIGTHITHPNLYVLLRIYQKLPSHVYIHTYICTLCLHLYLSIHIYSNIFTSYMLISYFENKLHIYASFYSERTITIIHFCSCIHVVRNGHSPYAFYYIFIVTFSRIYICTIIRCIYIYVCTYGFCAAEASALYSASTLSYMPARCLHSRKWQPSDTEKQGKAPWAVGRTRTWYALANNTPMRRDTRLACSPDPCCAHVGRHATWICLIRSARLATSGV